MQPLQPEQANFLLQAVYLPGMRNENRITKAVIEAIPLDKGHYRPDAVSRNALDLAWHITAAEMLFMDAVLTGEFVFAPNPLPSAIKNSKELSVHYADDFEQRFQKLSKMPHAHLVKIVDFRGMVELPAVSYLGFLLHHTVHHRGQLSTYLRPMGAKVPAIYGESYDSAQARGAAS